MPIASKNTICALFLRSILLVAFAYPANSESMNIKEKIKTSTELIKFGCGMGASKTEIDATVGADGSLTLRKLPGAQGSAGFKYSKKEAEGLASSLRNEVDNNSYNLSGKQIDCMMPLVAKIIDYILSNDEAKKAADNHNRAEKTNSENSRLPDKARVISTPPRPSVAKKRNNDTVKSSSPSAVNDVLGKTFGLQIGSVYDNGNIAAQKIRNHHDIITGDFNMFSGSLSHDPTYGFTIWTDKDYIIQAIEVNNYDTNAYESGQTKGFYRKIIQSWGDNTPINMSVVFHAPPNKFYKNYRESFDSNIRQKGGIKYTYACEREYNKTGTLTARSRMIFFASEVEAIGLIQSNANSQPR